MEFVRLAEVKKVDFVLIIKNKQNYKTKTTKNWKLLKVTSYLICPIWSNFHKASTLPLAVGLFELSAWVNFKIFVDIFTCIHGWSICVFVNISVKWFICMLVETIHVAD